LIDFIIDGRQIHRATELIPSLLVEAQKRGFEITRSELAQQPTKELWRAATALFEHGMTPILFRKLDPNKSLKVPEAPQKLFEPPITDDEVPLKFRSQNSVVYCPPEFTEVCSNCGALLRAEEKWGAECPNCGERPA